MDIGALITALCKSSDKMQGYVPVFDLENCRMYRLPVSAFTSDFSGQTITAGGLVIDGNGNITGTLTAGSITTGSIGVTGASSFGGLATFTGGADFSGTVDFSNANVVFADGQLCDQVARCAMNDQDVKDAILAVAAGSNSGFSCDDLPACINNHAGTISAIQSLVQDYINTGNFSPTGTRDFGSGTVTGVGGGGSGTELCTSTTDTGTYLASDIADQNVAFIIFGDGGGTTSTATYTAQETGFMVLKLDGFSPNQGGFEVLVNGNVVGSSGNMTTSTDTYTIPIGSVSTGDTIVIQNTNPSREVNISSGVACVAVSSCGQLIA